VTRVVALGLFLTGAVMLVEWLAWGRSALVPAATFGILATGIQVGAVWKLKPALSAPFPELVRGWAVGAGLRLVGIVLVVVAIVVNRELFPPLPTAFAYLAVVIPLLFGEIRLSK
jgi:hypothetical protein